MRGDPRSGADVPALRSRCSCARRILRVANCSRSRASCAKSAPRMAPCSSSTIASMSPSPAMPMASILPADSFCGPRRARTARQVETHRSLDAYHCRGGSGESRRAPTSASSSGPVYDPDIQTRIWPRRGSGGAPFSVRGERHSRLCVGRHQARPDRRAERMRGICRRRGDWLRVRSTLTRRCDPRFVASDLRAPAVKERRSPLKDIFACNARD